MEEKILVVDDESAISDIIKFNFEKEGYLIDTADNGKGAIKLAAENDYDLILLDIMMPKLNGFEALREIRKSSDVPVIMLTAREDEVDKVLGLELGADDYVVKPFSMRELLARVKAVLRRSDGQEKKEKDTKILKAKDLEINLEKYQVKRGEKNIELTLREFELLKFLASHPGIVFSREELLQEVWEYEYYGDIRTVDVTVRRLREKIEDENKDFKYIKTKRGVGYLFASDNGES
ncbi:MAG: response regulator transcription factor [Clostridium sp.]|uniref:Transcriptional regulatory protein YycF n=1 Tax=Peptoniphilus gorbachii TaxID=411567 RepID=A0A6N3B1H7_9FIRM|nr:response regulator transcription factor [Clostridium sp.]MBS5926731.1 response regulator transcription factor [Clostridium sp.]